MQPFCLLSVWEPGPSFLETPAGAWLLLCALQCSDAFFAPLPSALPHVPMLSVCVSCGVSSLSRSAGLLVSVSPTGWESWLSRYDLDLDLEVPLCFCEFMWPSVVSAFVKNELKSRIFSEVFSIQSAASEEEPSSFQGRRLVTFLVWDRQRMVLGKECLCSLMFGV